MLVRGSFGDLVFRMVMFHQSLDGHDQWPAIYALNEMERFRYCDPHLFSLMRVLMVADSESYTFLGDGDALMAARKAFQINNDQMVAKWHRLSN